METQFGTGFLPYEIGDIVEFKDTPFMYRIRDIRFIQYVKDKISEFEVLVSIKEKKDSLWTKSNTWFPATRIKELINKKK